MLKIAFLFAAIPALALGAGLEFINCVGAPPPKEVVVDECPQRPCQLEVGKTYNVHVTAHIDKPVTALPIAINFLRPNGEVIFYPTTHNDACSKVDGGCPLSPGDYTFSAKLTIPDVPVNEELIIASILRDQDFNPIACYSMKHIVG